MKDRPNPNSASPAQPFFRAGEPILETGIYRVFHGEHRVTHEVTLLEGEVFPECRECGPVVHFELLRAAPEAGIDKDFRIRLYQVPHPQADETVISNDELVC